MLPHMKDELQRLGPAGDVGTGKAQFLLAAQHTVLQATFQHRNRRGAHVAQALNRTGAN